MIVPDIACFNTKFSRIIEYHYWTLYFQKLSVDSNAETSDSRLPSVHRLTNDKLLPYIFRNDTLLQMIHFYKRYAFSNDTFTNDTLLPFKHLYKWCTFTNDTLLKIIYF